MTNPSDVGLLRSMLEIRSESGRESRLAHHLAGALRDRGFDSRLDEAGRIALTQAVCAHGGMLGYEPAQVGFPASSP